MPVFALRKQRLDPDAPLAHGFLILLSCMISPDTIKILFIKTPFEHASLIARSTLRLQRASIARGRIRLIALLSLRVCIGMKWQDGIIGTDVDVVFRVIAKRVFPIQGRTVVKVWQRNVRTNMLLFSGHNIFGCPIGGITRKLPRMQLPSGTRSEDEIKDGLIFHDL